MSHTADTPDAAPTIEAPIGYLIDTGEMPVLGSDSRGIDERP